VPKLKVALFLIDAGNNSTAYFTALKFHCLFHYLARTGLCLCLLQSSCLVHRILLLGPVVELEKNSPSVPYTRKLSIHLAMCKLVLQGLYACNALMNAPLMLMHKALLT